MKPTPAPYQGQAWPQHAVPGKISVRRGTVARPALTSAPQYRVLCPQQLVCTAWKQQGHQPARPWETAGEPPVGPVGRRPGEVGRALPRAHAPLIKMRWGVAIVIARHAAGLLPRPLDQACVIRSTTAVISSRQDPPAADAACRLRTRPVGGAHQSAGPTSRRAPAVGGEVRGRRH